MRNQLNKLYRQTQMDSAPQGRHMEISILEMACSKMRVAIGGKSEIKWTRELGEALRFNQKVWDVFTSDWLNEDCKLSDELRQNLVSLAVFIKKKTFTMLAKPDLEGVRLLIQLNENIVDGLRSGIPSEEEPAGSQAI